MHKIRDYKNAIPSFAACCLEQLANPYPSLGVDKSADILWYRVDGKPAATAPDAHPDSTSIVVDGALAPRVKYAGIAPLQLGYSCYCTASFTLIMLLGTPFC